MKATFTILIFAIASLFSGQLLADDGDGPAGIQSNLTCSFSSDTFWVCVSETYRIWPQVQGGVAPYTYNWHSHGTPGVPGQGYLDLRLTSRGTDTLEFTVTDLLGEQCTSIAIIESLTDCVWPGDANGNGIANHVDLLNIGRGMGLQGPKRPLAHTNWIGQASHAWGHAAPDGADFTHADADGDGEIHLLDIQAILKNYTFTPASSQTSTRQGPPFVLEFSDSTLAPGDTLYISVMLGDSLNPVDSVYGLAFSMTYDTWLVDSGSVRLDLSDSWLGTEGTDLTGLARDFSQHGQVDIAITRLNRIERAGYGKVAGIIVTIDDIVGKRGAQAANIRLGSIQLEQFNGDPREVYVAPSLLLVNVDENNRNVILPRLQVFPNPAKTSLTAQVPGSLIERLDLYTLHGQQISQYIPPGRKEEVHWLLPELPPGSYLLKVRTPEGVITEKIVLTN